MIYVGENECPLCHATVREVDDAIGECRDCALDGEPGCEYARRALAATTGRPAAPENEQTEAGDHGSAVLSEGGTA